MNNLLKGRLVAIIFFALPTLSLSFKESSDIQWDSYYEDDNISIEYSYQQCKQPQKGTDNEYVYLRIHNMGKSAVMIEFDKELWYNDRCLNCDDPGAEHHYTVNLQPGETKEADCGRDHARALEIFSKMITPPAQSVLTDFKLNNIKITATDN